MILHLDMDAFFASVEQLDCPELRGKPVIIGQGGRGVVATASYEARKFGIHSAMPVATARKLCPEGIFLRGRFQRYSELSQKFMASLRKYSPVVQKASIDEAYLDLKNVPASLLRHTALAIKESVAESTGGLTCSIGIAPVKFLAKICSDINKPDGLFILAEGQVDAFLDKLPVSRIPGVGKHMQASLANIGITRVVQLRRLSREYLQDRYGKFGVVLYERANGIDPRTVHENEPPKSESSENTFAEDLARPEEILESLAWHAQRVCASLRKRELLGRTITIKLKFANFQQITRSRTLLEPTDNPDTVYNVARDLFNNIVLRQPVRLSGVCVSGFGRQAQQLFLPGINGQPGWQQ